MERKWSLVSLGTWCMQGWHASLFLYIFYNFSLIHALPSIGGLQFRLPVLQASLETMPPVALKGPSRKVWKGASAMDASSSLWLGMRLKRQWMAHGCVGLCEGQIWLRLGVDFIFTWKSTLILCELLDKLLEIVIDIDTAHRSSWGPMRNL